MIFQPGEVRLILARRKTEVRLPVGPHRFRDGELEHRCRYRPQSTYRLQVAREWTVARLAEHRAQAKANHPDRVRALLAYLDAPLDASVPAAAGREITILDAHRERLGDANAAAMRRDGFKFAADFFHHYEARGLERDALVWTVAFVLDDVSERFDRPRLLAARPGAGHDYVERPGLAMRGEPEALTVGQLASLSTRSQQHWLAAQAEMARRLAGQSISERLEAISRGRVVPPDTD